MRIKVKVTKFYVISVLTAFLVVEAGARTLYFFKKGQFSHLLPLEKAKEIRLAIVPFKPDKRKTSVAEKGDFLIKNGYYTYNPKVKTLTGKDFGGETVRINNLGFRGNDISEKGSVIRVWCLGGSTTFGYHAKRTFPEMLDDFLNENQKKYEVINGGMGAFNIQHIYNMLRDEELVDAIKPDILVVNTFWNSIEQYENSLLVETVDNKFLRSVLKNSITAFFVYKGFIFLKYREIIGPFQALSVYLDKICSWAAKRGILVLLLNEPMRLDDKAWKASPEHPKNHEHASMTFRRFEDKYKGIVFSTAIPFFEKMDYENKDEVTRYFIDKGHLNEEGYAIEARELARVIQNLPSEIGGERSF